MENMDSKKFRIFIIWEVIIIKCGIFLESYLDVEKRRCVFLLYFFNCNTGKKDFIESCDIAVRIVFISSTESVLKITQFHVLLSAFSPRAREKTHSLIYFLGALSL